jgi:hypothetical protein
VKEMTRIWLDLETEWLKDNEVSLKKKANEDFGDPELENKRLLICQTPNKIDSVEVSDDFTEITFDVSCDGFFLSTTFPIDEDLLMRMMEVVLKRINKMRTAIEALK